MRLVSRLFSSRSGSYANQIDVRDLFSDREWRLIINGELTPPIELPPDLSGIDDDVNRVILDLKSIGLTDDDHLCITGCSSEGESNNLGEHKP